MRRVSILFVIGGMLLSSAVLGKSRAVRYPKTERIEHQDVYHGVTVADPYRWLEEDVRESKRVASWVKQQNKTTFGYLKKLNGRKDIRERLTTLWDYEKYTSPFKAGGRYYFRKNDGLQNQFVLYTQATLDDEPVMLIDPNTWSDDGTVALRGMAFSDDGQYLAYGVAEAGSDWRSWRVMHISSRKVLDDDLKWLKFGGVAWTKDGRGFFYSRFPPTDEKDKYQSVNLNQKL